jgi:small subunit ribosomal protein S8
MSMQDPIADLLTRLRNAQQRQHASVRVPNSGLKRAICRVLQEEGYIDAAVVTDDGRDIDVALRYHDGRAVIEEIKRVSRPGLRVYVAADEIPKVRGGFGVAIVSTPRGVVSDRTARRERVGGEVLCTVF